MLKERADRTLKVLSCDVVIIKGVCFM